MKLIEEVSITLRPNRNLRGTDVKVEVKSGLAVLGKYEFVSEDDDFVPYFKFLMERATELILRHARDERGQRLEGGDELVGP